MSSTLEAYGISIPLPAGWEGRAMQREAPPTQVGVPRGGSTAEALNRTLVKGWPGERTFPVVHLGNFALPPNRGDFGTGAVEVMRSGHVFMTLFEYGPESAGQPLFDRPLPRRLAASQFNANALQRRLPGQAGSQVFCTEAGRAFCVFVVLGAHRNATALLRHVNQVLPSIEVAPR